MRARTVAGLVLVAALMGVLPGAAEAARLDGFELRGRAGSLGQLSRTVLDDGAAYVSAPRLATLLKGSWTTKGRTATLIVGTRRAQFVRDQARVVVAGRSVALESPARVGATGWLIPEEFLSKGLGLLAPGVTAVAFAGETKKSVAKTVKASITLEELRYRSYPSFTRVVVETGGALAYVVVSSREEIRVRLPRLVLAGARNEEVLDGLVKAIRLDPVGGDAVLRVVLESTVGDVKTSSLQDPFRLVLDIYRQRDAAGREPSQSAMEPLRLIVLDAGHGGHDPGATGPSGAMEKDVVLSHAFAKEEVERFTYRAPGQANSYFYGYTKLLSLRKETESALGAKFNQKDFHDFILAQGLLPPDLMRQAVLGELVATAKAQPAR